MGYVSFREGIWYIFQIPIVFLFFFKAAVLGSSAVMPDPRPRSLGHSSELRPVGESQIAWEAWGGRFWGEATIINGVTWGPYKWPRINWVLFWRLTWNIVMEVCFRSFSFSKWVICRFNVNLPGCYWCYFTSMSGVIALLITGWGPPCGWILCVCFFLPLVR